MGTWKSGSCPGLVPGETQYELAREVTWAMQDSSHSYASKLQRRICDDALVAG